MSDRRIQIDERVVRHQKAAADPLFSVWVEANAGSGKTHVLTERVLRLLLLPGSRPEGLLCLTYTKAAAAEMRRRVGQRLAEWSLMDDDALGKALSEMTGAPVSAELLIRARTLFARALETPGGLRIETIHAFCEAVLHRFPLEAGVPFDFAVIEDDERRQMVLEARERVLAGGLNGDPRVAEAVATLFAHLSDHQITEAIEAALGDKRRLRTVLDDRDGARARLLALVGGGGDSTEALIGAIVDERLVSAADVEQLLALPEADSNFRKRLDAARGDRPGYRAWCKAFLKDGRDSYAKFPGKALGDAYPALAQACADEAERLLAIVPRLSRQLLVDRSLALLEVLAAISESYEAAKRARALLDFDDLIEHVRDLFADAARGPWVQYKLDAGIDHILVDESQDTNPEQWAAVKAIAREFFVGDSAVERPRTLFAVGDAKQSIYSFQGAEPRLFEESGEHFGTQAAAIDRAFAKVPLETSFRTLPKLLEAVDLVFADADRRKAVLAEHRAVKHYTARSEGGGTVTLWPPVQQVGEDGPEGWPLDVREAGKRATRTVAERIAGEIRGWLNSGRLLPARGRAVRADDILILVQRRGELFHEIIRALRKAGLPSPGADRLAVTGHIAVLDLIALGDLLINPADDLQLAALLRSPLFDVSEDDLYELAAERPKGTSLWQAMLSSGIDSVVEAARRMQDWRAGLDRDRPYSLFAEVLYRDGGLRRFHARLGLEVDDVLMEFLRLAMDHEQAAQPSLLGFLSGLKASEVTIGRELAESGAGIRVMTVHGAKGLEAPVVIIAEAAYCPDKGKSSPIRIVRAAPGPLLIHASSKGDHVPETAQISDDANALLMQEYWRRLYVAMTRAEDELYVTGVLSQTGKIDGTWYEALEKTLQPLGEDIVDSEGRNAVVFPAAAPVAAGASAPTALENALQPLDLAPLPAPALRKLIRPSSAGGDVFETAAESLAAGEADQARRRGIALHALLQHLPGIAGADRASVAEKAALALMPDEPGEAPALAARALSIISRPELGRLFGPESRAEVPFSLDIRRGGGAARLAGRLDRIVVDEQGVMVVDYKSDAAPPRGVAEVPGNYLTQLGLYALVAGQLFSGRAVKAAILWTSLESLMILPPDRLAAATADFTAG